jgi:hypothetical protein
LDRSECENVAIKLYKRRDTIRAKSENDPGSPPGCYENEKNGELYFNTAKTSETPCSSNRPCFCKLTCSPGTFQDVEVKKSDCLDAKILDRSSKIRRARTSCKLCAKHSHQTGTGKSFCEQCPNCPLGKYSNEEGQVVCHCHSCQPGKYNDENGRNEECKSCEPGRYHQSSGETTKESCLLCAVGLFASQHGSTLCTKCAADKTTKANGTSSGNDCHWCPTNTTTGRGTFSNVRTSALIASSDIASRCAFGPQERCNATLWSQEYLNNTDKSGCLRHFKLGCVRKLCPNTNDYHPDTALLSLQKIYADFTPNACDQFHSISSPFNSSVVHTESPSEYPLTGFYTSTFQCKRCRGDEEHCNYGFCANGYHIGTGCLDCSTGFYKYNFNLWSDCTKCNENVPYVGVIEDVAIALGSTYLLFSLLYLGLRPEALQYVSERKQKKKKFRLYQETPIGAVLPVLHQLHITALLIVIVAPPSYPIVGSITRFLLNVFTLDITSFFTSIQCSQKLSKIDTEFLMPLAAPLVTVVLFTAWSVCGKFCIYTCDKNHRSKNELKKASIMFQRVVYRSFAIVFFVGCYQPVIVAALSIFHCDPVNMSWIAIDGSACPFSPPSKTFPFPTNHQNDVYGIIGISVVIVYGIIFHLGMNGYLLSVRSDHKNQNWLDPVNNSEWILHMFDWVMHPFRYATGWWELATGVYKLFILSMLTASMINPGSIRFLFVFIFICISMIVHIYKRPYRSSIMNWTWVLFDITHIIGLIACVVVDTENGLELFIGNIDPAQALAPAPTSFPVVDSTANSSDVRRLLREGFNGNKHRNIGGGKSQRGTNKNVGGQQRTNRTTGESLTHYGSANQASYLYMMCVLFVFIWCAIILMKSILSFLEKERKKLDELSVQQGGTYIYKQSKYSLVEFVFLTPMFLAFGLIVIILSPLCFISIGIEFLIRIHYALFICPCCEYDIGNFFHIFFLDELRILGYSPIYIFLFSLRRTFLKEVIVNRCCKRHGENLRIYEHGMWIILYKRPWSKKINLTSDRQERRERVRQLRQEYQDLWSSAKTKGGKVYYYSKANPSVRKWQVPKMSRAEEKVRAWYTKEEYTVVIEKLGGKAGWKVLTWKQRLNELEKEQRDERKRKLQPSPPPPPPSTKVLPINGKTDQEEEKTNRFLAFIAKTRAKKLKKKAKKKKAAKKKKKLAKKEEKDISDAKKKAIKERKKLYPMEDDY